MVDTERAELRRSIGRLGRVLSVAVVRPANACVRYADMVKVVSTRDPRTRSAEGHLGRRRAENCDFFLFLLRLFFLALGPC